MGFLSTLVSSSTIRPSESLGGWGGGLGISFEAYELVSIWEVYVTNKKLEMELREVKCDQQN